MPTSPAKKTKKSKRAVGSRAALTSQAAKRSPERANRNRPVSAEVGEIMRMRAEAAIAEARKSHERLREAIDILPQGIVFLDADGRYIL